MIVSSTGRAVPGVRRALVAVLILSVCGLTLGAGPALARSSARGSATAISGDDVTRGQLSLAALADPGDSWTWVRKTLA